MGEIPADFRNYRDFILPREEVPRAGTGFGYYAYLPPVEVQSVESDSEDEDVIVCPEYNVPAVRKKSRWRIVKLLQKGFKRMKSNTGQSVDRDIIPAIRTPWRIFVPGEIRYNRVLDVGNYGTIRAATIISTLTKVAVKMAPGQSPNQLHNELRILSKLQEHSNIVKLHGALINSSDGICIVLEKCEYGSLRNFVADSTVHPGRDGDRQLDVNWPNSYRVVNLFRWSLDIANGLEFLHSKNVVYVDHALRNVLLNKSGTAKLADFDLSVFLNDGEAYRNLSRDQPLPVRWMALESLTQMTVSKNSDIWSYGVTLWELFNLAKQPLTTGRDFAMIVADLEQGLRPERPRYATQILYDDVLMKCWERDEFSRPSISEIKSTLWEILTQDRELEVFRFLVFHRGRIEGIRDGQ